MEIGIRGATANDATFLVPLVNDAAEGLTSLTWAAMARPGQTPFEVGVERIAREDLGISYRNAWIGELAGQAAGCLYAYRRSDTPDEPADDTTPVFVPLGELERMTFGTGYIGILATRPDLRGKGVGAALLAHAETHFRGARGMSLIVADNKAAARRLYARAGYGEAARRPMVKIGWSCPGQDWILMRKA